MENYIIVYVEGGKTKHTHQKGNTAAEAKKAAYGRFAAVGKKVKIIDSFKTN